ncbi:MAG: hypothetical protein AAFR46_10405 [Pseudomonadota bacterium]
MSDSESNVMKLVEAGVLDASAMTEAQVTKVNALSADEVATIINLRDILGSKQPLKPDSDGGFF